METANKRALWDQRLARFHILYAMSDADEKFGKLAEANLAARVARLEIEQRHGTSNPTRLCDKGRAELRAVMDAETAACDASNTEFGEPLYSAAIALLRAPAPDFAAVKIKMEMINDLHVDTCEELAEGEAYAIIQGELAALLREAE
jgi:hypothetical protein